MKLKLKYVKIAITAKCMNRKFDTVLNSVSHKVFTPYFKTCDHSECFSVITEHNRKGIGEVSVIPPLANLPFSTAKFFCGSFLVGQKLSLNDRCNIF